jgi:hypothetical protein
MELWMNEQRWLCADEQDDYDEDEIATANRQELPEKTFVQETPGVDLKIDRAGGIW